MNQKLNQINISYDPLEDRMLMRMTTGSVSDDTLSEVRVWLTRRYTLLLWSLFEKILDENICQYPQVNSENKTLIRKLQQDADLIGADFKTPYKTAPVAPAFGEEPLLLTRIQVTKAPDGSHMLNLAAEQHGINLVLNSQLIHSLMQLLIETTSKAQWDLPFEPFVIPEYHQKSMDMLM